MKQKPSLSVTEFQQLLEAMCAQADAELQAARKRMESLRSQTLPPG